MYTRFIMGLVLAQAQATPADDVAASAQAQLAVAQGALCRASTKLDGEDIAAERTEATRRQLAAQAWVDAWDTAGRPDAPREAVAHCRPDDGVTALYVDALVQMTQARFEMAQTILSEALRHAPKSWCAGLRLRQGLCALHRHAPQDALSTLQTAQGLDSRRVAIRLATAQAYLALGRPADTIASLRPMLSDATDVPEAHEIEQARALTGMAIEQDAGHISPLERTAMQNLLAMAQDSEANAQTVEMALSLADAVPRPRVQTAAALVALKGQNAAAGRRLLKEAFTQATLDPDPARLLALYNVEHGGPVAALPCLTLAAARDPFNSETQTLIAELSERTGAHAQAHETLVALMRLEPGQSKHKANYERVLAAQKQASSAAKAVHKAP